MASHPFDKNCRMDGARGVRCFPPLRQKNKGAARMGHPAPGSEWLPTHSTKTVEWMGHAGFDVSHPCGKKTKAPQGWGTRRPAVNGFPPIRQKLSNGWGTRGSMFPTLAAKKQRRRKDGAPGSEWLPTHSTKKLSNGWG